VLEDLKPDLGRVVRAFTGGDPVEAGAEYVVQRPTLRVFETQATILGDEPRRLPPLLEACEHGDHAEGEIRGSGEHRFGGGTGEKTALGPGNDRTFLERAFVVRHAKA
jgi:hypothetical protein